MPGPDPRCHIVEPERFEVDDEVWARIAPSIPEPGGGRLHRGKVLYSDRAIISGVLYFLRNDLGSWRRLPTELGFGTEWACPRRVGRWENLGVWEEIRAALERELPDGAQLDFSRVRGRRR
jgi:transposase